jgi:hypothetical protein
MTKVARYALFLVALCLRASTALAAPPSPEALAYLCEDADANAGSSDAQCDDADDDCEDQD